MSLRMHWRPLLAVCLLVVVAAALAAGTLAATASGPQPNRAWKPVTLVYLSDVKGKIEPCG